MAVKYERIVEEDLNLGIGAVDVTMPAGGTAVGHRIGPHTFTGLGFIATLTSPQAFVGGPTDVTAIFNAEEYDPAGWYDAATGVFTAAIAGLYRFEAYVYMQAFTGRFFVSIYKNGTYQVYDEAARTAQDAAVTVPATIKLEVGDTVTVRVSHSDGAVSRTVTEGRFSGFIVGRTPLQ